MTYHQLLRGDFHFIIHRVYPGLNRRAIVRTELNFDTSFDSLIGNKPSVPYGVNLTLGHNSFTPSLNCLNLVLNAMRDTEKRQCVFPFDLLYSSWIQFNSNYILPGIQSAREHHNFEVAQI